MDEKFTAAANELGGILAARKLTLVYGGGRTGLMGLLADVVLARGGEVLGVIPHALEKKELAHRGVSRLHIVDTMHERKALMAELADAFIGSPGPAASGQWRNPSRSGRGRNWACTKSRLGF